MNDRKLLIVACVIFTLGFSGLILKTKHSQQQDLDKVLAQVQPFQDLDKISEKETLEKAQQTFEEAVETLENTPTIPIVAPTPDHLQKTRDDLSAKLQIIEQKLQKPNQEVMTLTTAKQLAWETAKLVQNPPHSAEVWQEAYQNWQQIVEYLETIPSDSPDFNQAQNKLTDYRKNYTVIRQYHEKAQQAIKLNNQAIKQIEAGEYQAAITTLNQAVTLNSGQIQAYLNRGFAYAELNSHVSAIANYDKAIQIAPQSAEAYYYRGDEYLEAGDNQKALSDYNQAIKLNPEYTKAYLDRGFIYANLGQNNQAVNDFKKAAKLLEKEGDQQNYKLALEVIQELQSTSNSSATVEPKSQ